MALRIVPQFVSFFLTFTSGASTMSRRAMPPTDQPARSHLYAPSHRYLSQYPHCYFPTDLLVHYRSVINVRTRTRGQCQVERENCVGRRSLFLFQVIALSGHGSEALMPTISRLKRVMPTLHVISCKFGTHSVEIRKRTIFFATSQPATDTGLITS